MTISRSVRTLLGTLALATGLIISALALPVSARIVERGTFHEDLDFTIRNFCGVEGITVDVEGVLDGRFQVNDRGPGSLDYFMDHTRVRRVFTDRSTGWSVTDVLPNTINKDFKVTDNGDGTITVIALLTGGQRTYGHEGNLIARNSGQVRFEIVYDVEADEEISNELIFGSTGTNDDFCEAVLTDWGYL